MKIKRNYFLDFFRQILIFSFFGIFVVPAFSAEKFWWNAVHPVSEKESVFPKTAGNGEKTFSFWQEVDKSGKNIWLSARFLDSSGNWKILSRFAGPFEYAGSEIPDIYSAAMQKNGTVAVAVQSSDSELCVYVLKNYSENFEKANISVPKGEFFAPRIYASFSGKFVMFASKSKISDSTLRLHEFFIYHSVSDDGLKWLPFSETFSSSMPNSFAPFMCGSENSDFVVFQSQFSQGNKNSYQIYVSHSENGGRSWSAPVLVTGKDSVPRGDFSDFDNQAPFILFKDEKINLVWERKTRGTENSEIWYEQILKEKVLPDSVDVIASRGNCRKAGLFDFKDEIYAFWFDNRSGYEQVYLAKKQKIDWEETRLSQQKIDSTFPSPLVNGNDLSFVWQSKSSAGNLAAHARNSTGNSAVLSAENRIMSLEPDKEVSAAAIIPERQGANSTLRSKNRRVSFKIKLPYDISGIQGYAFSWSQDEEEIPRLEKKSVSAGNSIQLSAEKEGWWYLKVCVLDNAGNWSKISSSEYYLDLTPPKTVVFEPLETDAAGFLSSNYGNVRWQPDFLDDDIKGYSYALTKIAEIPQKFCSTPKNKAKASEQELKNYAENILRANEKSFQRKIKLSGAIYKNPVFSFKNQRNGLYVLSVSAVDEAGYVGEAKNIPVLLNKYEPRTYISSIKENVSSFGDITIEISGNDFAYDGTIRSVIVDSDGKPPYDFVVSKDAQNFNVSNSKISGINLGHELDEGSYFVGVVHSNRGISFTKTKALKISPNGTVQIENEYEYIPSWKIVEKKYEHSVFVGYIVLFVALVLFSVAVLVFGISFFKNYAEIYSAKKIVTQLESGGLMPQFQKSKKEEKRRNGSLKTSLAGFAISLVVAIIIIISLSLGLTMIKGQERTLSKGLHDRVNVLLSSVFSGARTYLQNADENTMEFNDLLNQMSSLSEAEFLTITGEATKNSELAKNLPENDSAGKNSVLYVWASNDANITSKVNRLSARRTIIPGVSMFSSAQELEQEILQRCSELNLEAYEICGKTEAKIAELNSELRGATNSRRAEISNLNAAYRNEIQKQLLELSEKGSGSVPPYNDEKFNRNVTEYLFYRPVLYSTGASNQQNQYVHGILFLKVNTDSLIRDIDKASRSIFYIVIVLSAIAIVFGIFGANLFAGRIVRPIQMLEKTVTEISEENDKERLLAGDITDLPNNEIGRLGDSVNRMKKDLGYNERELNLQANEATPIQQAMVSLVPLAGNFKQNISRISDEKISEFAYYKGASGASGDYFDFKKLDERWYVLIKCDASGHAAPAGILVTIVATLYKKYFENWSYQKNGTKLEDFIYKVNGFLESLNIKGKFVAMIVSLYDSKTGNVFMCHAGDRFVRIYENSTQAIKKIELAETPAAGPFPNFMLELKGGFKVEQTKLNQKDVLILYTDGIEENGRILRTPDFAAVLKPKTDSNGEQIYDEYGNPEYEAEKEEFGENRVSEIIEAVFQKKKYILTKKDNPSVGETLEFDFTNCQGTVEEATLALASLEKLFRLYKPVSATVKDLVEVDIAIDGFLKKYFSLYEKYAVPPTQESFNGRPVRKPKNPNNVFYSYLKEDAQEDDLTMICLQRN